MTSKILYISYVKVYAAGSSFFFVQTFCRTCASVVVGVGDTVSLDPLIQTTSDMRGLCCLTFIFCERLESTSHSDIATSVCSVTVPCKKLVFEVPQLAQECSVRVRLLPLLLNESQSSINRPAVLLHKIPRFVGKALRCGYTRGFKPYRYRRTTAAPRGTMDEHFAT